MKNNDDLERVVRDIQEQIDAEEEETISTEVIPEYRNP